MMVRKTILRERYDVTPWQMAEWCESGRVRCNSIYAMEQDVRQLVGRGPVDKVAPPRKEAPKKEARKELPDNLVSIADAAEIAGVSRSIIKNTKNNSGKLEGPNGFITKESLEKWMASRIGRPMSQVAEEWGVTVVSLQDWKRKGLVWGGRGLISPECERPELNASGRMVARYGLNKGRGVACGATSGRRVHHKTSPGFDGFSFD